MTRRWGCARPSPPVSRSAGQGGRRRKRDVDRSRQHNQRTPVRSPRDMDTSAERSSTGGSQPTRAPQAADTWQLLEAHRIAAAQATGRPSSAPSAASMSKHQQRRASAGPTTCASLTATCGHNRHRERVRAEERRVRSPPRHPTSYASTEALLAQDGWPCASTAPRIPAISLAQQAAPALRSPRHLTCAAS
jgi:hypothetical protein